MTYKTYLDDGGTPLFKTRDVGRPDGAPKHQCSCGGWDFAQFMIDVRAFDIGDDFACGGCVSSWERNMVPIMSGDDFLVRQEWRASLTERRNGDKDAGAEWVKVYYLTREKDKAIKRKNSEPDGPEMAKITSKIIALENRIKRETI